MGLVLSILFYFTFAFGLLFLISSFRQEPPKKFESLFYAVISLLIAILLKTIGGM